MHTFTHSAQCYFFKVLFVTYTEKHGFQIFTEITSCFLIYAPRICFYFANEGVYKLSKVNSRQHQWWCRSQHCRQHLSKYIQAFVLFHVQLCKQSSRSNCFSTACTTDALILPSDRKLLMVSYYQHLPISTGLVALLLNCSLRVVNQTYS